MFLDYMLENNSNLFSGNNSVAISEETLYEVNSLEVPDYSYDDETPFEIVERSIKEFVVETNTMFNDVANTELAYLREFGVEPVWESSDSNSVWDKFISFVKGIIAKITGSFKKLIETINKKIDAIVTKKVDTLNTNVSKLTPDELKNIGVKTINSYEYQSGVATIMMAANVEGNINATSLKGALAMVNSNRTDHNLSTDYGESSKSKVSEEIRKHLLSAMSSKLGDVDYTSASSVQKEVNKAFNKKVVADTKTMLGNVNIYLKDKTGKKTKDTIKKTYEQTKKSLSAIIDKAKNYKKALSKDDKKGARGKATALLIDGLNTYTSTVTMVYNETTRCITSQWFQAVRLYFVVSRSARKAKGKDND